MTNVIIPIKRLQCAKQRLSDSLTATQRADLVVAMLQDLLSTLARVRGITTWILTSDPVVLKLARSLRVRHLDDSGGHGYNAAVSIPLKGMRSGGVAIIPGDVPLASAADIWRLVKPVEYPCRKIRIAHDQVRQGTNGLFLSTPQLMQPSFGVGSYMRHLKYAQGHGIEVEIIQSPGLGLDIDTYADVLQLASLAKAGYSYNFLSKQGFFTRPNKLNRGAA